MQNKGTWLITLDGMAARMESVAKLGQIGIEGVEDFYRQRPESTIDSNGIAHIHAMGCLLNNPPNVEKVMGNTSYQDIIADIEQAKEDGARGIFLNIDSPGGMAEGAPEAAAAVANSGIPTVAHTEGSMCSAAYFLAAGANQIAATGSSSTGSIGTVLSWMDQGGMLESIGINTGVYTNDGADLKRIDFANPTEEQREFIQGSINENAAEFQGFVRDHRPQLDAEVFRAGHYSGAKSVELGLIDAVSSKSEAVGRMVEWLTD